MSPITHSTAGYEFLKNRFMKNDLFKQILPHFIAVLVFLIVSLLFAMPALQGNVLNQHDIIGWNGVAQNAFDYKDKYGHFPLWNTHVFSGMPNYLIAMEGRSILPDLTAILTLGLPQPINFFFLACICFYVLCMAMRVKPVIAIFGALAFAFATYNPIIISAGHITKMFAIAYMPLLLAGLILTFEKKYWAGLALTTLGTYLQVGANHPQISFYLVLVSAAIGITYLVTWIRQKDWKHAGIAFGITVIAALAGLMGNSLSFLVTSEYSKATIRGGKTVSIQGDQVTGAKTEGLDTSYAFAYSLAKAEVVTTIMPNAFGGSARRTLGEDSKVTKKLTERGIPEANAAQLSASLPQFWGEEESTAGGPLYSGAIVVILALIGFVLYKKPIRWGLLAIAVIGVMMAWGKNLAGFNLFLFENMPLYNKFRAPSITMVIVQLVLPIAAVLGAQWLFFRPQARDLLKQDFKKILYALGGLFGVLAIMYLTMDYSSSIDAQVLAAYTRDGSDEMGRLIISGLKQERQAMFGGQVLRTLGFILLVLLVLWLFLRNALQPLAAVLILGIITVIDLVVIDKEYLPADKYQSKDELAMETTTKNAIDQQILADTSMHYRVYNAGNERFSAGDYHVSAFHKSIGGYHPAKLRIYQDVIQRYLGGGANPQQVLNMLNTKYIIVPNPQTGQPGMFVNDEAYGPCWLVKHVKMVKDDVEELQQVGSTNLKDTALVQESFAAQVAQPRWDSAASLTLVKYDNDEIEYVSASSSPQFGVFSEVYYPYGWNAYIDGSRVDYVRTNYILRGLSIPAGKHTIKFVFEPATYKKGVTLAYVGSFIITILVLGGFFMAWREWRRNRAGTPTGASHPKTGS